jgi:hypothetical protein
MGHQMIEYAVSLTENRISCKVKMAGDGVMPFVVVDQQRIGDAV